MNRLVVMKFGGTSVEDATAILRTAQIVAGRLAKGVQPVVVVSAMAKVTDLLISAAATAARGDRASALAITERLRIRHADTATQLAMGPQLREDPLAAVRKDEGLSATHAWMEAEFDGLEEILRGLAVVGELTPRISDMIVSYGERVSSRMITEAFVRCGLNAVYVDARKCIVTDAQYGKAIPQDGPTEERLKQYVAPHLAEAGVTTTLGRGGSDFTAALVGGGIDAGAIEIWTDVDGIMTADPRVCPGALRVKTISFEEAAELAYFGAKVLHPATILPAVKKNIPVFVLNSKNPDNSGTRITALAAHCKSPFKSIAVKKRLTIMDIVASRMLLSHGYLRAIFEVFDKHKCPIDMVSTSEVSVSLSLDSNEKLPAIAADLSKLADVKYEGRKALVCMVGEDIRGQNGIAARVFQAIRHVNLRMISQGASEINMSFMVEEDDAEEAVRSLHAEFFSDPGPEIFDVEALRDVEALKESVR